VRWLSEDEDGDAVLMEIVDSNSQPFRKCGYLRLAAQPARNSAPLPHVSILALHVIIISTTTFSLSTYLRTWHLRMRMGRTTTSPLLSLAVARMY
jgi:hypothetical protein